VNSLWPIRTSALRKLETRSPPRVSQEILGQLLRVGARPDPPSSWSEYVISKETVRTPQRMHQPEQRLIYLLLKFGQKQHLEEFRHDGLLFMTPLADFVKLEESETGRGDSFEGTATIIQPKHLGKLTIDTGNANLGMIAAEPEDLAGVVRVRLRKTASCNVYCMVAVTNLVDGELVPNEVTGLGDWFVIVTNIHEFLCRVLSAAKDESNSVNQLEYGLVEYYDADDYSGETGRFRKRSRFAHQREFRIVVEPGFDVPRKLCVGSLLDITTEVLPSSAALQGWRSAANDTAD